MKRNNQKNILGFTLIELLVLIAITAILALISVANYREAERRKRVEFARDGIINALNLAQTYTLAGKSTNNTDPNCRVPQFYYVGIYYTNNYTLFALNNCGGTDIIESFTLPERTTISANGLTLNGVNATMNLRIAYYPPFAETRGGRDVSANTSFSRATVTIESDTGSFTKTLNIDGITGRVTK